MIVSQDDLALGNHTRVIPGTVYRSHQILVFLIVFFLLSIAFRLDADVHGTDRREPAVCPQVDLEVSSASGVDVDTLGDERVALASGAVRTGTSRRDRTSRRQDAVPRNGRIYVRGYELECLWAATHVGVEYKNWLERIVAKGYLARHGESKTACRSVWRYVLSRDGGVSSVERKGDEERCWANHMK